MRQTVTLFNPVQGHAELAHVVWPAAKALLQAGHKLIVEVRTETRSLAQNRRLWAMLSDVSLQVEWYGQKLAADEWKCVFTAALKTEKVVPGINGGFVVLGQSTRKMTRAEMSELQTLMEAFGAERGVKWSRSSIGHDDMPGDVDPDTGEVLT